MEKLVYENGELVYYKNDKPHHAGVVRIDGAVYYISKNGRAVKGVHIVHSQMTNGIIKHGTYTFGDDYKLIEDSYVAPKVEKKRVKSKKRLSKKSRNISIICFTAVLVIVGIFAVCLDGSHSFKDDRPADVDAGNAIFPSFDEEVPLCSDTALMLFNGEISVDEAIKGGNPYRPFVFEYNINEKDGKLVLSENKDMTDSREFVLPHTASQIEIDNLKTGTTYYYIASAGKTEKKGSFTTAESFRFLSLPGIINFRDIGGYTTLDGKTVKQGLIIRGTEIDGLVEPTYYLKEEYVEPVLNEFGFVRDFDLRVPSVFVGKYQSPFGSKVSHKFYSAPSYGLVFNAEYKPSLRAIFSDLADADNYPMYLHCTHGTDRTGTIVFLIQCLLNMSERDIRTEYELTAFYSSLSGRSSLDVLFKRLDAYEGDNLQEKTTDFLVNTIGVSKKEVDSIKKIFLED